MSASEILEREPAWTVEPQRRSVSSAGTARVLLRACRPRQWSKNVLLAAAPAAAAVLGDAMTDVRVALGILAFCALSSATYLVNDVRDRDQDRHHPRKRHRPIASGELSTRTALTAAASLAAGGLALAAAVRPALALVGFGYLALTFSYSLWWRHVILLDILAVAGGFFLRTAAGGVAAGVPLSRWFLLVTACGAVFLVAGKRYAELADGSGAGITRGTLRGYTREGLLAVLGAAALGALTAYAIWAMARPGDDAWYALTMVPVIAWLGRYALLLRAGVGEAPEELILHDRVLLALSGAWTALFLIAVYNGI